MEEKNRNVANQNKDGNRTVVQNSNKTPGRTINGNTTRNTHSTSGGTRNGNSNRNPNGNPNKRRKKKKRPNYLLQIGIVFASVLFVALIGVLIWASIYSNSHFLKGTIINDIDASGMTVEELEARMRQYNLQIRQKKSDGTYLTETITGDQIGIKVSDLAAIDDILDKQNVFHIIGYVFTHKEKVYEIADFYSYPEKGLENAVSKLSCFSDSFVVEPVDAHISDFNEETGYQIVPEVIGNQVNKVKVKKLIKDAVDSLELTVDLEKEECYIFPQIYADDARLTKLLAGLKKYTDVKIVYQFGDNQEVVDGRKLNDFLDIDEESATVTLDESQIDDFVIGLRKKYDTIFRERNFRTSYGSDVKVSGGDYGWWMNYGEEQKQLKEMIENGESGERVPVYYQTAAAYGEKDYGNTYVEVNLTAQHLFLIVDGKRVLESDFVSGNASRNFDTPEGTYSMTYKETNALLVGENYETPVSYWMPFNGNVGLHDAVWRDNFGSDIYKKSGSHGCVNLPYKVAKEIYGYVSKGTPVICYHLPGTESTHETPQDASARAQAVIDAIDNIGQVTKDSQKKIDRAQQLYNEADAEAKEAVTNYDTLKKAKSDFAEIKK